MMQGSRSSAGQLGSMSEPSHKPSQGLLLDVEKDKAKIEEHIADHIHERLPNVDRTEIMEAVEGVYEKLLKVARVKTHIPTLAEHEALEEIRKNHRDD